MDLDEKKLLSVMRLKGFKTRKQALDYALDEAERRARVEHLLREPPPGGGGPWVREGYDPGALRGRDRAGSGWA